MKIREIGEFGLIELINRKVANTRSRQPEAWQGVIIGIGDDAAAWETANNVELATTDTLVQEVHFSLQTATWEELGWKSMTVNISDIGAMGGIPRYALVTLALPGDTSVEDIDKLYDGMLEAGKTYDVAIVGGDIVNAPCIVITVTLWGSVDEQRLLKRSGAQPGDKIAVTGFIGDSAGGLTMLKEHIETSDDIKNYLRKAHLRPQPRSAEGQLLASFGVKAAIDVSDGLVADLEHVCQSSNVSALVHIGQLPLSPQLKKTFGNRALHLALFGGEDYELLFSATVGVIERIKREINCQVTVVGEITSDKSGKVTLLDDNNNILHWEKGGWDHFASNR